jgi:hypothetical protein
VNSDQWSVISYGQLASYRQRLADNFLSLR